MSHYLCLALTATGSEVEVEALMEPYREDGEWFEDGTRWDWYQVGGRWTGWLDEDYDPEQDPRNLEPCGICGGSGERPGGREQFGDAWYADSNGCNGCHGEGKRLRWPTEWAEPPGNNRAPVSALVPDAWPYPPTAVLTPDGKWHEATRMGWFGMPIPDEEGQHEKPEALWTATVRSLLAQHPHAIAVVVDAHV